MALLDDVKAALGIDESGADAEINAKTNAEINAKILAVKEYIDLPDNIIDTALGDALVVIGVTDLWNVEAGEIKFSPAFNIIWRKLDNKSLEAVDSSD